MVPSRSDSSPYVSLSVKLWGLSVSGSVQNHVALMCQSPWPSHRSGIIDGGDVGHPDPWLDRRLLLDARVCPDTRIVILGNRDRDRAALREAGFATQ